MSFKVLASVHGLLWILATVALSLTLFGWRWSLITLVAVGMAVVLYTSTRKEGQRSRRAREDGRRGR
jgi:hypothetical protein